MILFILNIKKVASVILKSSANKKGFTPNSKIGLSQPKSVPSHRTPNKYMNEVAKESFRKLLK